MISALYSRLKFLSHDSCKEELHKVMQLGLDDQQKIKSLNSQLNTLLTQIHELKAINDFQAFDFEKKITELEKKLSSYGKSKRPKDNTVKIEDFKKEQQ